MGFQISGGLNCNGNMYPSRFGIECVIEKFSRNAGTLHFLPHFLANNLRKMRRKLQHSRIFAEFSLCSFSPSRKLPRPNQLRNRQILLHLLRPIHRLRHLRKLRCRQNPQSRSIINSAAKSFLTSTMKSTEPRWALTLPRNTRRLLRLW